MMSRLRELSISLYGIGAFVIIVLATVLRLLLIAQGYPVTNSDEGTIGLMAMHIAYRGELPIFFYGQGYMGPFEAYLGAGLFLLFGPSLVSLRLGLVLVFAFFLLSTYLLTSLLYTKSWALVMLVLLGMGTDHMLGRELTAMGGYAETLLFSSGIFFLVSWLALSFRPDLPLPKRRVRFAFYGCWGLLVGLAIWTDVLSGVFALTAGLLLVRFCWGELRTWAGGCPLLGLLLGTFPMIAYNVIVPFRTLTDLWNVHHSLTPTTPIVLPFFLQNILGTLLFSLPLTSGAYPLCPLSDVPPFGPGGSDTVQCVMYHGSWGMGYLALLAIAAVLAIREVRKRWKQYWLTEYVLPPEERAETIRNFARLMLLVSAGLTLVFYTLSPVAAQTPASSARYLIGLLVCAPAVLWPLWNGIVALRRKQHLQRFAKGLAALKGGILLFIITMVLLGTVGTFSGMSSVEAGNQRQAALISELLRLHDTHIYSEFDICNRLIFLTREQIICSVLDTSLRPGVDRYLPYRAIVRSDPHAAYVFPEHSAQAAAFAQKIALSEGQYRRFDFDGYVVYKPI